MKIRASIIGLSIVGIAAISGGVFALSNSAPKKPIKSLGATLTSSQTTIQPPTVTAPTTTTVSPQPQTVSTVTQPTSTKTTTATTTTAQPTTTTPNYGQDTTMPNLYRVFDQTSVMTAAGIATTQQSDAANLISKINADWVYYDSNSPTPNLCMMATAKMSALLPDWQNDPIGQLKVCNNYAISRYGSWSTALASYTKNHQF